MSCRELTELLTDHLEGRLGLVDSLRFQWHLGLCKHCRAYLAQMRGMVRALGQVAPEPSLPPALEAELLTRFRNFRRVK